MAEPRPVGPDARGTRAVVTRSRPAGPQHAVVSVEGAHRAYRRSPCGGCPWKVANAGDFPAQAFAHSAATAYDLAEASFGCHEAGSARPAMCAGFLLRGAQHNLAVRLAVARGQVDPGQVGDGGHELFADYRAMAVANGVDPDDPALGPCR